MADDYDAQFLKEESLIKRSRNEKFRLSWTIGSAMLLIYTIILWGLPVAPALAVF